MPLLAFRTVRGRLPSPTRDILRSHTPRRAAPPVASRYRTLVEEELKQKCDEILGLVDTSLLPQARGGCGVQRDGKLYLVVTCCPGCFNTLSAECNLLSLS